MLKVNRPDLPMSLQKKLDERQEAVNNNTAGKSPWNNFKSNENYHDKRGNLTVKAVLKAMFHDKCVYCEGTRTREIEHYWPKSPAANNHNQGTASHMFDWHNLLWACHICNSPECKGTAMEWDEQGNPKLLNPCLDDPLCYITINLTDGEDNPPFFTCGMMMPKAGISPAKQSRAAYTIKLLKLNEIDSLKKDRAMKIRDFLAWVTLLFEYGPDYELPHGYSVRQRLVDSLDASRPYLAAIRQILYVDHKYLYQELIDRLPELETHLASWALAPDDC